MYGEIAFNAYREKKGKVAYNGEALPEWSNLSEEVKEGWEAAGDAVAEVAGSEYIHDSFLDSLLESGVSGSIKEFEEHYKQSCPPEECDCERESCCS